MLYISYTILRYSNFHFDRFNYYFFFPLKGYQQKLELLGRKYEICIIHCLTSCILLNCWRVYLIYYDMRFSDRSIWRSFCQAITNSDDLFVSYYRHSSEECDAPRSLGFLYVVVRHDRAGKAVCRPQFITFLRKHKGYVVNNQKIAQLLCTRFCVVLFFSIFLLFFAFKLKRISSLYQIILELIVTSLKYRKFYLTGMMLQVEARYLDTVFMIEKNRPSILRYLLRILSRADLPLSR